MAKTLFEIVRECVIIQKFTSIDKITEAMKDIFKYAFQKVLSVN